MPTTEVDSPINVALRSFEAAEANLGKLERLFDELRALVPDGVCFGSDVQYEELCRSYADVLAALPAINGWKPSAAPIDLNELAQWGDGGVFPKASRRNLSRFSQCVEGWGGPVRANEVLNSP